MAEVTRFREGEAPVITLDAICDGIAGGASMMKAINAIAGQTGGRIDKIAFAKAVVEACREAGPSIKEDIGEYLARMRIIFRKVNSAVRGATEDAANRKLESLVAERAGLFAIDHPEHATREQGRIVLDQIEAQLDDSPEAEAIRNSIVPIRRDFKLQDDPADIIMDHEGFLERVTGLKYAWRIESSEPAARAAPVSGGRSRAKKPKPSSGQSKAKPAPKKTSGRQGLKAEGRD